MPDDTPTPRAVLRALRRTEEIVRESEPLEAHPREHLAEMVRLLARSVATSRRCFAATLVEAEKIERALERVREVERRLVEREGEDWKR